MIAQAKKLETVIAGSLSVEEGGLYYNRWYCAHPDGRLDYYDKRHLFSFGKENEHYTPGERRSVVDIKGWKVMPLVCYDLRFPVWCRNDLEYDLIVVVANWPAPRIHHWDILLKARAIENQSYIAAVNRIGVDGTGLHYPGHSCIYDMHANNLLDMKDKEGIAIAEIEKEPLMQYRDHFRFLQDRDSFNI
jgi:predicted amidohydrolase